MNIYVVMFLCGLAGVVTYCLEKMRSINIATPDATPREVIREFVKTEWLTSLISVFVVILCEIVASDVFKLRRIQALNNLKPGQQLTEYGKALWWVGIFIKTIFIFLGYLGQRFFYKLLGRAEKRVDALVEKKLGS